MPGFQAAEVVWPGAGSADIDVADAATKSAGAPASIGGLPIRVRGGNSVGAKAAGGGSKASKVKVELLSRDRARRAGHPMVLKVSRADGGKDAAPVNVELDYSQFRHAFGADWDSRLALVSLPECALTTPDRDGCGTLKQLETVNDATTGKISADADVSGEPMVLAMTASSTGQNTTDFAKTDFKLTYTWAAGRAGGDFTWDYPMQMPKVPGDLVPDVSLSYNSGGVDGQTAGENVQPAWGEGWNYTPGYIERSYNACKDDLANSPAYANATTDLCWRLPNARMILGGKSVELILGSDGVWRADNDDAAKVELITGGTETYNWNNEKWKVTTPDGTQYFFGLNRLPGWQAGDRETGAVWGAPVFSNHTGEPCFNAKGTGFGNSWCAMAYRWNLDYVVNPHGNTMSLWYSKEFNRTGLGWDANAVTGYDRGGDLGRIEFGTRAGTGATRESSPTATPTARVTFVTADRCLTASCGTHDKANWPDTPWDLDCPSGACANNISPTFWTAKRKSHIVTEVWTGTAQNYERVDEWALGAQFPATGNATSPVLWLSSITRTGKTAGGSTTLPSLITVGTAMQNRADYDPASGMPNPMKYRVTQLRTETGGQIEVTYSPQEDGCKFGQTFPDPDNNTKRCFPLYRGSNDEPIAWGWWHKHVVTKVVEKDLVGGAPAIEHNYTYSTEGANTAVMWAHDDGASVFTNRGSQKSWSDWRGYPTVIETTGTVTGQKSQTKTLYYRGLDEDMTDSGEANRVATVTNSLGEVSQDEEHYSGIAHEVQILDGPAGQVLSKTFTDPVRYLTGTRTLSSSWAWPTTFRSYIVRTARERVFTWLSGTASWRTTEKLTTWNSTNGVVVAVDDRGDTGSGGDDVCVRSFYTFPAAGAPYLISYPNRVTRYGVSCTVTPAVPTDVMSDARTYYDNAVAHTTAPTRGLGTKTELVGSYTGTTPNWIQHTVNVFDQWGRITSAKDTLSRETKTLYTQTAGMVSNIKVTNPAGHEASTTVDRLRGVSLALSDANAKVTTAQYDPLGRLVKLWKSSRPTSATPDVAYVYSLSKTSPSYVETKSLAPNGNQISTFQLFDGLLRPRQTQETSAYAGKRTVTDVQYDARGLGYKTSEFYNADSAPTSVMVTFNDADVDRQQRRTFDGASRQTKVEDVARNIVLRATSTQYAGDRITTVPPTGGITTQELTDARGRVTEKRQYGSAGLGGSSDATVYQYNDDSDQLAGVTDPMGNAWTYEYDTLGRLKKSTDPDAGVRTATFDNAGQQLTSTDGNNKTLAYTYDSLGRKTSVFEDSTSGKKLASWLYDTIAKGQLTSSTRTDENLDYVSAITGYDNNYQPTGTKVTIPASPKNGALAGDHVTSLTYKDNGAPATRTLPAVGGLPAETLTYSYYNETGAPYELFSGQARYVDGTSYHYDGQLYRSYNGAAASGKQVWHQYDLDPASRRMTANTTHTMTGGTWSYYTFHSAYTYDHAGNITNIGQFTNNAYDSDECFSYDHLRRLTEAWTTTGGCATPSRGGTSDPYWRKWTFDKSGNRLTQVDKNATAGDTTWTYTTPAAGAAKPHTLSKVDATGPLAGTATRTFGYDSAGSMTARTTETGVAQTLAWDREGHLATVTEGTNTTSYVYNAEGERLISRTPSKTTLTLPGGQELELMTSGGAVLGSRQYTHNGKLVALRDAAGLKWVITDHLGTAQGQIDSVTHSIQRRRSMPYGETRGGSAPGWAGNKGYVGGTVDSTGLTHLGAREYDPSLGRFVSVDPLIDYQDPQQIHGYAYSNNSPITFSDPDGLILTDVAEGLITQAEVDAITQAADAKDREARLAAARAREAAEKAERERIKKEQERKRAEEERKRKEAEAKAAAEAARKAEEARKRELEKWAKIFGDVADAMGFIPSWICAICGAMAAGVGVLSALLYALAGNIAKTIAQLIGVAAGLVGGKFAKAYLDSLMPKLWVKALEATKFMRGQTGRRFLARAVQADMAKEIDNIFAGIQGILGTGYSALSDKITG